MKDRVIESSTSPLLRAIDENLDCHVAFIQRALSGMLVDDSDDLWLVDSGLPSDTFNKILRARLSEDRADHRIREAIGWFRERRRPFAWWVGPCSRPLDLEERLVREGLRAAEYELGMVIDLADLPPAPELTDDTEIRRVTTTDDLADFAGVLAGLFEPPDASVINFYGRAESILLTDDCPMRLYVARVGGVPAATTELFLGGGVAGIHMVGTANEFRRRGLGWAMTWTALDDGRRTGLATGVLQASEAGQSLYEKLGFRACCRYAEYQ